MLVAVGGLLALFAIMGALAAYLLLQSRQKPGGSTATAAAADSDDEVVVPGARRAGGARMRRNRARQQQLQQQQQQQWAQEDSDPGSEEGDGEGDEEGAPLNRKEAKRREKAAQREAERAAREAKANKVSGYEERRRKKEEEREALEREQEEEMRRAAEERQAAEDAEASKWMNLIAVEGAGEEGEGVGSSQEDLLSRFIAYVQQRKMVGVEELATEFGLRSAEVVERLGGLEAAGRLTGVMDERGKYIYISPEEMGAVARYIRSKGRVAIGELAARSNDLIDLESKVVEGPGGEGAGAAAGMDLDALLEGEGVAAPA